MLKHGAEAVTVGMPTSFESFVNCEEQPWPDCGGPSHTVIPPHPVSGGKTTLAYSGNCLRTLPKKYFPFKGSIGIMSFYSLGVLKLMSYSFS